MTDRELLELAAKAAGIEYSYEYDLQKVPDGWHTWDPLNDDGDALRLAVKLGLAIIPYPIYGVVKEGATAKLYRNSTAIYRGRERNIEEHELYEGDPVSATRRAIVKAAAAIGEAMP